MPKTILPSDVVTQQVNGKIHVWILKNIWDMTRDEPVIDIEISTLLHLDHNCWFTPTYPPTLRAVVHHCQRINEADMSYPIVVDPNGQIFDGAHRVARALLHNQKTIKAVRLKKIPAPDRILNSMDELE